MRDPYQVLGVPSTATDEEVKKPIGIWPKSTTPITITTIPWPIWHRRR